MFVAFGTKKNYFVIIDNILVLGKLVTKLFVLLFVLLQSNVLSQLWLQ